MPLNFPDTPSLNQVYTSGSNSWQFDGTVWNALSSSLVVSTYGPTGATGATGSFNSTTQTIDFSSNINCVSFTVTGITSSNQVYAFDRLVGYTAHLKNADSSLTIVGVIEKSETYSTGTTFTNYRSADIQMCPPFTMGITSYTAEELTGLTLTAFGNNNIFTRDIPSGIPGDGGMTAGFTFAFGRTFDIGSLSVTHKEESYAVKTITGQSWVAADTYITCKCLGLTSADHDAEDAIIEGVRFEINNIVPGTGFDIIGHAPEGTYGKYQIKCLGQ